MATLDEVVEQTVDTVLATLNAAGGANILGADPANPTGPAIYRWVANPPFQCGYGWPYGQALSEILGQYQAQVTVWPLADAMRNVTDRMLSWKFAGAAPVGLNVSYSWLDNGNVILTFVGSGGGLNVHTIFGEPEVDAYYLTQTADDTNAIATAVMTQINATALANGLGVTATAANNQVFVNGASKIVVNIGGAITMKQESRRMMCPIQVTVWAEDPDVRNAMAKQIEAGLGLGSQPFLPPVNGELIRFRLQRGPIPNDLSQSSYSLYIANIIFEATYPTFDVAMGATIGAVETTISQEV